MKLTIDDIISDSMLLVKKWNGQTRQKIFLLDGCPVLVTIKLVDQLPTIVRITGETTGSGVKIVIQSKYTSMSEFIAPQVESKLTSVLHHELDHYENIKGTSTTPKYNEDDVMNGDVDAMKQYLTDPHEVSAFVAEIAARAMKQKTSFNEAFKQRIKPFITTMTNNNVDQDNIIKLFSDVKATWFNAAARRYPQLQLQ